jgi:hypothetical protein
MACNSHGPPTLEPQPDGPASHHDPKEEATRTDLALVNDIPFDSQYYGFDGPWFFTDDAYLGPLVTSTPAEGFEYYRTQEPDSFGINFNPPSPNDAKADSSYTMVPVERFTGSSEDSNLSSDTYISGTSSALYSVPDESWSTGHEFAVYLDVMELERPWGPDPADPHIPVHSPGFVAFAPSPDLYWSEIAQPSYSFDKTTNVSNDKSKIISKRQKASMALGHGGWVYKISRVRMGPVTTLQRKQARDILKCISMVGPTMKYDLPFIKIKPLYFVASLGDKLLSPTSRTFQRQMAIAAPQSSATEPEPRIVELEDESPSPGSETDWDEDESDESDASPLASILVREQAQGNFDGSLIQRILAPAKSKLIDRLMEEFWVLFHQLRPATVMAHGNNSTASSVEYVFSLVP